MTFLSWLRPATWLGVLLVLLAGCDVGDGNPAEEPFAEAGSLLAGGTASPWPELSPALPPDPALEKRVADILHRMTVEEKVGQIIQPEIKYITPEDVRTYHLGAVLNGGGTTPHNDKHAPITDWVALADALYEASMDTSDGGQAIPVMWGSDAVHGHNNLVGATLFPHNIGLGAARDPGLLERIGRATAREVRATGLDWTFAPTLAVARDVRWGRTFESYAEDPRVVREYAQAMVRGIQGEGGSEGFLDGQHVIANAKHYLGDGGTAHGIDRGDTRVSEEELARVHAAGFIAAIEAGVQTVMASFSSWNGERLHGHRYLLTDVLKGRLGFDGFVVGDWNGHRFVPGCRVDSCPAAVRAGIDMFMVPADWKPLYQNTLAQVKAGEIPVARLDDAVSRILRVKLRAGLFEAGPPSGRPLAGREDVVGSAAHRRLAREAVRRSLVLLKNNDQLLPLAPDQNVLVAGAAAADVSRQSGGWTLSWQGTGNEPADFPGATTIFQGIRQTVEAGGGQAVLSEGGRWDDGTFTDGSGPDVAVVVFGEEPYAEWLGDLASIEYQRGSKSDLELLRRIDASGIPVAAVFLSGRPLWVNKEINAADAFVAAWLPGSEGGGVADVLFREAEGSVRHDFTGRLSFSWPQFVHQRILNPDRQPYEPLFPYGFGLSSEDDVMLAELSEEESYVPGDMDETWLFVARPIAPWNLQLKDEGRAPVTVTGHRGVSGGDGNVGVAASDWTFEDDARTLSWQGGRFGSVMLSADEAQNLSRYAGTEAALSMAVRVDRRPSAPVHATMECTEGCSASVSLNQALAALPQGDWQDFSIDLGCFVEAGADLERVSTALALGTAGPMMLSVANVRIIPGAAASADVRCAEPAGETS